MTQCTSYGRDELLLLYTTARPSAAVADCVRALGLNDVCCLRCLDNRARINPPSSVDVFVGSYRGRRSGRYRPPPPSTRPRADRHFEWQVKTITFGCLNTCSLSNKLDDILEVTRNNIDVLFLVESRHDSDSVCVKRLRADGFLPSKPKRP